MRAGHGRSRTLLGELLRQRGQTAEELSEEAEELARKRGINATLSPRHIRRLIVGRREDGQELGAVRSSTRRLLEELFGVSLDQLLSPVANSEPERSEWSGEVLELRTRLASGRAVDDQTISLLQQKLDLTRVIDRRLGAATLLGELREQINQMWRLLAHMLDHRARTSLAKVLVDASTLAGWQSLDQGLIGESWKHYEGARSAAWVAESPALEAYACAGQAVVLLDIGDTGSAVELTGHACAVARDSSSGLLNSWLMAGHGEALAAHGDKAASARAFDNAARSIDECPAGSGESYLVFDHTHLTRWRGSALARLRDAEAIDVLTGVLDRLDPTFARAETALRVDLVQVLTANGESVEASAHAERARLLAVQVGSSRQRRRLQGVG